MVTARTALQIPSFIIALIATVINLIALATPAWQVVFARELQQWIQSGLWMNCQTRPSGMLSCIYTFTRNHLDPYSLAQLVSIRTPAFYDWQHNLLYILLLGQFLALFAMLCFCYSQASDVARSASLLFTIAICLSAIINIGCNIAFQIFAHMVEYRFYHVSVSGIYEKHPGYSYFLHLIGSILLILSFLFSLAYFVVFCRTTESSTGRRTNQNTVSSRQQMYAKAELVILSTEYVDFQAYQYRYPQEDFAMRALPELPSKYHK
ncbi:unnamed protein product [Thelazia callipaeda]|uniref:Clc-like protein n=1 Tax=Thelazia callipaeda TaxID=103827 RepID=A0A0N5CVM1_THECL|nr:unnamed protein product [Thelazia callipaeda]